MLPKPLQVRRSAAMSTKIIWLTLWLAAVVCQARVVNIDWTPNSEMFDNGVHTRTVFVRMNDLLKFKCPAGLSLQIHLMPALDVLECRFSEEKSAIGYCSPETTDPRLVIRKFSPMPDQPLFAEGEAYYFTAATNDSTGKLNDGLCRKVGMRLRVFVLPKDAASGAAPIVDLTRALWLREQIDAVPIESRTPASSTRPPALARRTHHIKAQRHETQIGNGAQHAPKHRNDVKAADRSMQLKYDITKLDESSAERVNDVTEFNNLDRLPNPMANHLPQLDFEIGYEDSASQRISDVQPWVLIVAVALGLFLQ